MWCCGRTRSANQNKSSEVNDQSNRIKPENNERKIALVSECLSELCAVCVSVDRCFVVIPREGQNLNIDFRTWKKEVRLP